VIFGGGDVPSLHELREAITRFSVNCLFLGPSPFNVIIDEDPEMLSGVGQVLIGGEAMSPAHLHKALARLPRTRLFNVYGPTETTTFATTYAIPADFPVDARSVPIGTPVAQTECYICDDSGQPVPDGGVGELYIGGAGVALGYINQPELTASSFVDRPLVSTSAQDPAAGKLYRTGDLCRRLPDGNIDFVGRVDQQVKIHGRRIEPGEIEVTLTSHPAVSQCVVLVREFNGDKHLAAYFTAARDANVGVASLRDYLGERLPSYMVPRLLIRLPHIPLTRNGKIDRKTLPPPDVASDAQFRRPDSEQEGTLLSLWREVLQSERIGVDDCWMEFLAEPETGGWTPLIEGKFSSHCVPGDHFSMLKEPNVGAVAQIINRVLKDQA
jgi:acyl-coenzyme A synthetase/AMP-(fatty) acid ligase